MRKILEMIGMLALVLSLDMAQANPAPPLESRFALTGWSASKMDPSSGFCAKMYQSCVRGNQNACNNYFRHRLSSPLPVEG